MPAVAADEGVEVADTAAAGHTGAESTHHTVPAVAAVGAAAAYKGWMEADCTAPETGAAAGDSTGGLVVGNERLEGCTRLVTGWHQPAYQHGKVRGQRHTHSALIALQPVRRASAYSNIPKPATTKFQMQSKTHHPMYPTPCREQT